VIQLVSVNVMTTLVFSSTLSPEKILEADDVVLRFGVTFPGAAEDPGNVGTSRTSPRPDGRRKGSSGAPYPGHGTDDRRSGAASGGSSRKNAFRAEAPAFLAKTPWRKRPEDRDRAAGRHADPPGRPVMVAFAWTPTEKSKKRD
jgi:hypothetical protein